MRRQVLRAGIGLFALASLVLLPQQHTAWATETSPIVFGQVLEDGLVDCFEKGLKTSTGDVVYCEASAVTFDHSHIILASDKAVPGRQRSSVFSFNYPGHGPLTGTPAYLTAKPFHSAVKYEDMSLTPDAEYVIATTGFDRVKTESSAWNGYNTMLLWPVMNPDAVTVVAATTQAGITSSVSLRAQLSRILANSDFPSGVPYFKVEGIAAIPGRKLLFGIRETGADYRHFSYTCSIVSVSYSIANGELTLGSDLELIYAFDPSSIPLIRQPVGLSSIEYDPYHQRLYLLTSFETDNTDEGMGGYLWVLPMADLRAGKPPALVLRKPGSPLLFTHKPEGVTVLADNRVLVIHDDDRVLGRKHITNAQTQFRKAANQAAYNLISLTPELAVGSLHRAAD